MGDMMVRESYKPDNRLKWYIRFFYDVSIFIVLNITMLNIIFGIIIDTFAALRDKMTKVLINMNTVCFICSLDKITYDKTPEGYEHHVTVDHNPWNYLFYIYYVMKENPTEFTGIDSYVYDMLRKEDIFWFPIGKSLAVNQMAEQVNTSQEKFSLLFERIRAIIESNRQLVAMKKKKQNEPVEHTRQEFKEGKTALN